MKNRLIVSLFVFTFCSINVFSQSGAVRYAPLLKDKRSGDAPENFSLGEVKGVINAGYFQR